MIVAYTMMVSLQEGVLAGGLFDVASIDCNDAWLVSGLRNGLLVVTDLVVCFKLYSFICRYVVSVIVIVSCG